MGLTALLIALQPQLAPSDDIYIADCSGDRSGLKIARLYGSSRSYLLVEVDLSTRDQALASALEHMRKQHQEGILVISENVVISQTLIASIRKASKLTSAARLIPNAIITPYPKMPTDFRWFNSHAVVVKDTNIVFDDCYYFKPGEFGKTAMIANEVVVVLPYKNPQVRP